MGKSGKNRKKRNADKSRGEAFVPQSRNSTREDASGSGGTNIDSLVAELERTLAAAMENLTTSVKTVRTSVKTVRTAVTRTFEFGAEAETDDAKAVHALLASLRLAVSKLSQERDQLLSIKHHTGTLTHEQETRLDEIKDVDESEGTLASKILGMNPEIPFERKDAAGQGWVATDGMSSILIEGLVLVRSGATAYARSAIYHLNNAHGLLQNFKEAAQKQIIAQDQLSHEAKSNKALADTMAGTNEVLRGELEEVKNYNHAVVSDLTTAKESLHDMKAAMATKDERLREFKAHQDKKISALETDIARRDQRLAEMQDEVKHKYNQIKALLHKTQSQHERIASLEEKMREHHKESRSLAAALVEENEALYKNKGRRGRRASVTDAHVSNQS